MKQIYKLLFLFTFTCNISYAKNYYLLNEDHNKPKVCTKLKKPVKYNVVKGDHIADIIRTFGYKPIFKPNANVERMGRANKLANPNLIQPGQKLIIPFKCEEHTAKYTLINSGNFRLIDSNYLVKVKTFISRSGEKNMHMLTPHGNTIAFDSTLKAVPQKNSLRSISSSTPLADENIIHSQKNESQNFLPPTYFRGHSLFYLGGLIGYSRIDSTEHFDGATTVLLSKPIYGLKTGLDFKWIPKLSTGLHITWQKIEFRKNLFNTLSESKQTITGVSFNKNYEWTDRFKSILFLNYDEQLYVNSIKSGTAVLQAYHEQSIEAQMEYTIFKSRDLNFDTMIGYKYKVGSDTESAKINNGSEYKIGFRLRQQLERLQIELKTDYTKNQLDSSFSKQDNTNLKTQIGIKMRVGK